MTTTKQHPNNYLIVSEWMVIDWANLQYSSFYSLYPMTRVEMN